MKYVIQPCLNHHINDFYGDSIISHYESYTIFNNLKKNSSKLQCSYFNLFHQSLLEGKN